MHKESLYTASGLEQLAQIIAQAKGSLSLREFEDRTGVSDATIRRLINCEVKNPDDTTLMRLAPRTPYSFEELKAIAQERIRGEIREYRTAEDLLPSVNQLPFNEQARLAQLIVGNLSREIQETKSPRNMAKKN